jgi:hypothetical protein
VFEWADEAQLFFATRRKLPAYDKFNIFLALLKTLPVFVNGTPSVLTVLGPILLYFLIVALYNIHQSGLIFAEF